MKVLKLYIFSILLEMDPHHQQRYLCSDQTTLFRRVANAIAKDEHERVIYENLMMNQIFIPAGNTLLAGACPITPNCCVLGRLDETDFDDMLELSKKLWTQRTGIGYDLSGLDDPVARLMQLSDANHAIDLVHRPRRGNMAVLSAHHPRIKEFISCKRNNNIYNFNISVAVRGQLEPELLRAIAELAWETGDPGLVFLDAGEIYGPLAAKDLEPVVTCVPCGEQFMHRFETCTLGAINLNSPSLRPNSTVIVKDSLRTAVHQAISFMDAVIDRLVYPDERIQAVSLSARRIGLGVMGFADYLKQLGVPYTSNAALHIASDLSQSITYFAEERSRELAQAYGPCKYGTYRNLSLTCIAPTGGISGLIGNKGYGIEPMFEEASQIDYRAHIAMQAAWQAGIHNAVSKTINLPSDASVQTVIEAYAYAQTCGLKGVTIYRDQSKPNQPMCLQCE
jgi:ribonucleoside-diphosphate reductase alpha chain